MRRHIIIEGMDGSGKDTLIESLLPKFPNHTLHARASTSLGGPVDNLADWTVQDVTTMHQQPPSIYNRHPLVSEPIYAKYRSVKPGLIGVWANEPWVISFRRLASTASVMVICQPPFNIVRANLRESGSHAHMPGVYEHMLELYTEYATLVWPGPVIRYDYLKDTPESLYAIMQRVKSNNG
jgi:hypothetical protein